MSLLRFILKKDKASARFFVKLRRESWRLLWRKSRFLSIAWKSGLSFQRAGRGSLTTAEKLKIRRAWMLKIIRSLHQALIFRWAIMCSCRISWTVRQEFTFRRKPGAWKSRLCPCCRRKNNPCRKTWKNVFQRGSRNFLCEGLEWWAHFVKCAKTNACVWSEAEAVAMESPVRKLFCGHTQRKTVV